MHVNMDMVDMEVVDMDVVDMDVVGTNPNGQNPIKKIVDTCRERTERNRVDWDGAGANDWNGMGEEMGGS